MAKKKQVQRPTYQGGGKVSEQRRAEAAKRAAQEQARRERNAKVKKFVLIGSVVMSIVIITFSVFGIISCASRSYEPITISELYSTQTGNKAISPKIQSLNDEYVSITGYMSNVSHMDNKVIYIMSSPNQSCPFCYDIYGDAMPIRYSNALKAVDYTAKKVQVKGRLQVKTATEPDGMETPFRIFIDRIIVL